MRSLPASSFLALAVVLTPVLSRAADFQRLPYLQAATDHSIHIVWRTDAPIAPVVKYGGTPDALDQTVSSSQISLRQLTADADADTEPSEITRGLALHSAPKGTAQYEVLIEGLAVDTPYYYAVFDGEKRLTPEGTDFRFRTHPVPGTERGAYFWVVGDSGTGGRPQIDVHEAMIAYTSKIERPLDLYLHVGDMAYGSGTDAEFTEKFFTPYEKTLRNTVCWAILGNHEGKTSSGESGTGPFYDCYICPTKAESGGLASGREAYYSFDYGKVHFIGLDSHDLDRRKSGAMAEWLKADLEATNAAWLVAYWHHPPYTKGTHDSDTESQLVEMREQIMPILESGGVDIVFTGHSHIYERSMLIDGAYATPTTADGVVLDDGDGDPAGDGAYAKSEGLTPNNGVIQIVAGHGGTTVGRKGTSPVMRKIIVENGSVLCDIQGNTLAVTMLNHAGEVRDTFSIVKAGTVAHTPIEDPYQPSAPKKEKKNNKGEKVAQSPLPASFTTPIEKHSGWKYLAGSDPAEGWANLNFDDSSWPTGAAGFGYGDNDDTTELGDMKNRYTRVYIRHDFTLADTTDFDALGLAMRYDDGFIAYVNGAEVLRIDVDKGAGKDATGFKVQEASAKHQLFSLSAAKPHLKLGRNVIAIEGHNANLDSTDFTLDPFLIRAAE
jgi:hypothetical protein